MDLSTLFLGTAMTVLLLAGAGLGAAMVLLERSGPQPAQPAGGVGRTHARYRVGARRSRPGNARHRKA
jgi:hypothetical protein